MMQYSPSDYAMKVKYLLPLNSSDKLRNNMMMRWDYYHESSIIQLMIPHMKDRETVMLVPKFVDFLDVSYRSWRMLKISCERHLRILMHKLKVGHKVYNFYESVSVYDKGIPIQTMGDGMWERRARINELWGRMYYEMIKTHDCFIDVDCGGWGKEIYDCANVVNDISLFLHEVDCPHHIRYSGKGFHIIIPGKYFSNIVGADKEYSFSPQEENSVYNLHGKIAKYFYDNYTEEVDLTVYDARRVNKLVYSIVLYEEDAYVCLPIDDLDQLRRFDLEEYALEHVMCSDNFVSYVSGRENKLFCEGGNVDKLLEVVNHGKKR